MPGLPRKSTANQFKKLMKKSGKSKTNKSTGGKDPSSRKISTYEQFISLYEAKVRWFKDGKFQDPVNFDIEYDEPILVDFKIGDILYSKDWTKFGVIVQIDDNNVHIDCLSGSKFICPIKYFNSYGFRIYHNTQKPHSTDSYLL